MIDRNRKTHIDDNGLKMWGLGDRLHREDGPALMWKDYGNYWFLDDIEYSFDSWCKKLKLTEAQIIEMKLLYV